jgi:hypothetical protein
MLGSDRKIKLWSGFVLCTALAAIVILDHPVQHERTASREVVIDMPNYFDQYDAGYAAKYAHWRATTATPTWAAALLPLGSGN